MGAALRRVALASPLALAFLLGAEGPAAAQGPWPNDPQGPLAREISWLYWFMFAFAVVVFAIVGGALLYAGIRYRERPGHRAEQFHGNNFLELTWTVVPTLMVITFTVLSFQRLLFVNDRSNAEMTIQVEARQWTWKFTYPDEPMFRLEDGKPLSASEELHIPANAKVKLELNAVDVIHSFWVPVLGGKQDAVPGRHNSLWIEADRPGTYKGQCFEFCGDGHADMLIRVVAHPKGEYAAWARQAVEQANRGPELPPAARKGFETYMSLPCVGCHLIEGTQSQGRVGPPLTHMASKKDVAGAVPMNEENLAKWLKNPQAVKPGTAMPNYNLSDQVVSDVVQYLLTLK